jgi:small subunit ribosomal protein S20
MAHHKSAKKRIRSDAAKYKRGHSYIASVRTAVKNFQVAVETGAATEVVKTTFVNAQRLLAKASTKGLLHKNTASRKTGRLALLLKKFEAGEIKQEVKKKSKKKASKAKSAKKKAKK